MATQLSMISSGCARSRTRQVISYLESENAHTEAAMKPTAALQEKLYNEMVGHIKETDENVPYREGDYFYYSRTVQGTAVSNLRAQARQPRCQRRNHARHE